MPKKNYVIKSLVKRNIELSHNEWAPQFNFTGIYAQCANYTIRRTYNMHMQKSIQNNNVFISRSNRPRHKLSVEIDKLIFG